MTISDVHKDIAATKIMECKYTTSYSDLQLKLMSESALFVIDILSEINNKTVFIKNIKDEDVPLLIHIDDIKFFHNDLLVYAKHNVLQYLKDYILDKVLEYNNTIKPKYENAKTYKNDIVDIYYDLYDIRITGNGYGNAIVVHYDAYRKSNLNKK